MGSGFRPSYQSFRTFRGGTKKLRASDKASPCEEARASGACWTLEVISQTSALTVSLNANTSPS